MRNYKSQIPNPPSLTLRRTGFKQIIIAAMLIWLPFSVCKAVTSKVTKQNSSQEFLKGETNDVVINSRGTIQLARKSEVLVKEFEDVWSINAIVTAKDTIYIGTSPNGGVYSYGAGGLKKIYSAKMTSVKKADANAPDTNDANDANTAGQDKHLANEHIFAMATDNTGKLLVGISGRRCALCRLEGGQLKTIFEPNDANYIFAITVDKSGDIYIGTGPQGKIYKIDTTGKKNEVIYDCPDKNILSLIEGKDGILYAGSDTRGIVYMINPRTKDVKVLFDSEQQEITSLLILGEDLYATATSAQMMQAETRFAAQAPAGKPEKMEERIPSGDTSGRTKLQIANTKEQSEEQPAEHKNKAMRPAKPAQASYVYKITKDGFVNDIFSETAVFFTMTAEGKEILVGTGNNAQLFSVEPNSEQKAIIFEDKQASEVTAAAVTGNDIYVGLANPAKLVKLDKAIASEGTYTSDLIDAGQPAKWGKLQIEADIPQDCQIMMACRSGNVKDINDPTFSKWTQPVDVNGPEQLECPTGRFAQYKLILKSKDGKASPIVREVALADTVPNLAPRVESINVTRMEGQGKNGVFKIAYEAKDDNGDKLIYKIDFRKAGRTGWIEIKKDAETPNFEWDSKTVEDGRYEIRVTANDERSNAPETAMTGSRVSDTVVVDNTGPYIEKSKIEKSGKKVTLKMTITDELSAIGKVEYTVDSDSNWMGTVPDDGVYDTTSEDFTIVADKLTPGQHVIALKLADDVGNVTYKSYDVTIEEK